MDPNVPTLLGQDRQIQDRPARLVHSSSHVGNVAIHFEDGNDACSFDGLLPSLVGIANMCDHKDEPHEVMNFSSMTLSHDGSELVSVWLLTRTRSLVGTGFSRAA